MDTTEKAVLPDENVGRERGFIEKRSRLSDRKVGSVQGGDVESGIPSKCQFSPWVFEKIDCRRRDIFWVFYVYADFGIF